jgi:hypothetical protein
VVNLVQVVQILSAVVLAATLFALLGGLAKEQPATISIALGLLTQLGALVSSSPLLKKTTIETNVIQHLKGAKSTEPQSQFQSFLKGILGEQKPDKVYKELISRGIISEKTVNKDGQIFREVRLSLRSRLL